MEELSESGSITLLGEHGPMTATLVSSGDGQQCVVVVEPSVDPEVIVRIQSSCLFSESLGAIDCDCNDQLKESLRLIGERGGVLVYLFEEGRGSGIDYKFKAIQLQQSEGIDTAEAFARLGLESDPRDYSFPAQVLSRVISPERNLVLLTNNPTRASKLASAGVLIARTEPLIIRRPTTEGYLAEKAAALGHEV